MIPRMTTVGTLKNYRYNLNQSNNTLGKAMNIVTSRRLFSSYAEDPSLATRCFQIRHAYWRAESQYTVNESLRHKYDVAWQALGGVTDDLYDIVYAASAPSPRTCTPWRRTRSSPASSGARTRPPARAACPWGSP